MSDTKQLQVNDVVFGIGNYGGDMVRYVIDRVTKTLACSGNRRFNRDYWADDYGSISTPGSGGFHTCSYRFGTPELTSEYIRLKVLGKVKNIKWDNCSVETLKSAIDLAEKDNLLREEKEHDNHET